MDPAERLIRLIGAGDRAAFDRLFHWWAPTMLGIAARMLGNHQDAEAAVSATFERIWHRAAGYDPVLAKSMVWGFTQLRAVCIDRLRKQERQTAGTKKRVSAAILAPATPHSDEPLLPTEVIRPVKRALERLPTDAQRCLELAVFLEYADTGAAGPSRLDQELATERLRDALETLHQHLKSDEN